MSTTDAGAMQGLSLARQALLRERLRRGANAVGPDTLLPRAAAAPVPASFAQRRLWFLDQLDPGRSTYTMLEAVRLEGSLDVSALEHALAELTNRHESLRTTFENVNGEPVQVIAPAGAWTLSRADASARPPDEREARVAALVRELTARPFDLRHGPLFRCDLLRLAATQHVLLLSMHHIVIDGLSRAIIFRELDALYAAFARGEPSPLPPLPLQYGDYAVWEHAHLRGERLARLLAFWRRQLGGAPALLELPTDRPRPPVQRYRGAVHGFSLPQSLSDRLAALARGEGTSLYTVLLAAFKVLLARYARQTDVVVGTSLSNRPREELEGVIGFFVSTLVLRTDLAGDPTFREVVGRVRETVLEALAHPDLPFEKLVEELQPERSLAHSPIFQTYFNLNPRSVSGGRVRLGDLTISPVRAGADSAAFDLTLSLTESPGGLGGVVEYNTDLFDAPTIARMGRHFEVLLDAIVTDPGRRVSGLPLLTEEERRAAVGTAPRMTAVDRPLHATFEAQVDATPDAVAIADGAETLSYRELDERANRLAHALRARGVGPERLVGLCVERGPAMVVGILAILKSGGAYVPLDPAYPDERLRFLAADAGLTVIVTSDAFSERLAPTGAELVRFGADADEIARHGAARPRVALEPGALAYVIYTSGSTGAPKGVLVTHANVARLFTATQELFHFDERDVWTLFHSYAFDFSVWEMWGALLHGGRLVVVPYLTSRSPETLRALLSAARVTMLSQTPSAFQQLVRLEATAYQAEPLALRWVMFGGEALEPRTLRPWLDRYSDDAPRLANLYGITETTVHVTWRRITGADVYGASRSPVGGPLPDLSMHLFDPTLEPVPDGVPGEVFVGGAGVARGYLGRPALTAERFIPDPFSTVPGARLYRSGDLARRRAGEIEFAGRADDQVKVRGFRIEPGEIESALRAHPAVSDALVLAREEAGETVLAAYAVVAARGAIDGAGLRAFVAQRLPEHMVPAGWVVLEAFPLTANGKIDRRALPAPSGATAPADGYVAPCTEVERALARIWAEVLRVERVGTHDNFFVLGGHSLRATQVVARVRRELGVEVPLRALFEGGTIADLAGAVERARSGAAGRADEADALRPVPRAGPLPVAFAQRRLWFLQQLHPDSSLYNVAAGRRLSGALDRAALEHALGEIVRRHEPLRTVFAAGEDGEPVQVVLPPGEWLLATTDLSFLAPEERADAVRRTAAEEASRPFDLARGPLFRARLLRLAADEHVLLWAMHHVVTDGWSQGVFHRELGVIYDARAAGREAELSPLAVQYADYAAWQRATLRGAALELQLDYWRRHLDGAPVLLELPTDRPRPAERRFRGATHGFTLPPAASAAMDALASGAGATPYMALLAVFALLLSRYAGQDDVVVGTPVAGRDRIETEALIGFFVNTLPVRVDLSGRPTFRGLLARVRDAALGAFAHQRVPFEKLVEQLRPERTMSHSPIYQAMFALQNASTDADLALSGVRSVAIGTGSGGAKVDVTLHVVPGEHPTGQIVYDPDLLDDETVRRMGAHFCRLLERAVAQPDAPVSALDLLSPDEERAAVRGNGTRAEYPAARPLHALLAEQAARTPDVPAVVFEDDLLTYAQLDASANRLARHLRRLGVGPELRVAICMERSVDALVALWAVLKAGGAYVPVDPSYPADRIAFMLDDSAAPVILTQERVATRLPATPARIVCVDRDGPAIEAECSEPLPIATEPDHLAYVIYTSGSTGRPKGVQIQHRELLNYARGFLARLGDVPAGTTLAMVQPFSFDSVVTHVFAAALAGATLHVVSEARSLDADGLADYFARHPMDFLKIVPSHLAALLDHPRRAGVLPRRWLIIGGEGAHPAWVRGIQAQSPCEVFNHYGATETSVAMSMYQAPRDGALPDMPTLPLGTALPNTTIHVLDGAMRHVPPGVAGEIFIGGRCLARGYLNRPALSAERFVPDPFSTDAGGRLYRTGDRGRRRADGTLEFLGRVDHQVKLHGFRIEPGEIETILRRQTGVQETVVLLRADAVGPRLVAYVVGVAGAPLDGAALQRTLRDLLPQHMVPSALVVLDALPRTSHGKLDRRALPAPEHGPAADAYVAPRDATEVTLAAIWAEVLHLKRVGVHDDFFALGGHSLLATQLVSRIRGAFARDLPFRALFESPTVAGIARALDTAAAAPAGRALAPIPRRDRTVARAGPAVRHTPASP